jgi:putative protein kinase ArgK-like GTPase of G3E family
MADDWLKDLSGEAELLAARETRKAADAAEQAERRQQEHLNNVREVDAIRAAGISKIVDAVQRISEILSGNGNIGIREVYRPKSFLKRYNVVNGWPFTLDLKSASAVAPTIYFKRHGHQESAKIYVSCAANIFLPNGQLARTERNIAAELDYTAVSRQEFADALLAKNASFKYSESDRWRYLDIPISEHISPFEYEPFVSRVVHDVALGLVKDLLTRNGLKL